MLGLVIILKIAGGDVYEIPFAVGRSRFSAIRFALELVGARKADLEFFRVFENEVEQEVM